MNTNTVTVNKNAETADLLTARAANLAVMQALTDAWNALTIQQQADFTENVDDIDDATIAITPGGNSARLVDDECRRRLRGAIRRL